MSTSGMGSSELRSLTMQDFRDGLKEIGVKHTDSIRSIKRKVERNPDTLISWNIQRVKTGQPFYTFSTPEALSFILEYLETIRGRAHKYLFTSYLGTPMSSGMITYNFTRANDLAGLGRDPQGNVFFHSHGLRSFFASMLYKAGLPQLTIDWFLGHKINRVTEAYFKADRESLKNEYMKIVPELTFTEPVETRVLTDDKLKEYEERDKKREAENQQLRKDVEELKRQMNRRDDLEKLP